jgi:nicotinate-nucleotide adenylyltransferase
MSVKQRIGIYPGTFDPIHQGHVSFASQALKECSLDQVVFLPEPAPREKHSVSTITERTALINEAIKDTQKLSLFNPSSTQFTVRDTLPELLSHFGDAELTFLVGSDIIRTFPYRWHDLDILLSDVSLAIGMRTDDTKDDIVSIIKQLEDQYNLPIRYTFISTPDSHRASSHVRNSSTPSSDILKQQFGSTKLIILDQNLEYRIIKTVVSADDAVLELSLVTFDQLNVTAFPDVHQTILAGESIGTAYQNAGILFKRNVTAVQRVTLPSSVASYFKSHGQATIVEVDICVGPQQTRYCSILEIYSPAVDWPEPETAASPTISARIKAFAKLLDLRAQNS